MVHQARKPSSKALGKRPMRNGVGASPSTLSALTPSAGSPMADEETDEGSFAPSAGSAQTRLNHKRVLPTRRRGGIGTTVGTNEIDLNILDMVKRKGENEPLIPARTVFILTTDSSVVPSASTSGIGLNNVANERYFERPEVIKAYKAQIDIQVPEFCPRDEEMVGGRLRPRTAETEAYEISDEAYEKRHRKHEMIEKRQRLREKEKLQHEHYKLKERIGQLRNMDPNAFLALPSDAFGEPEDTTSSDLVDGVAFGSAATLHEAERRRKLMLEVALSLEERYRILLPPDRKTESRHTVPRASASAEPSIPDDDLANISAGPYQNTEDVDASTKQHKAKLTLCPPVQSTPYLVLRKELSRRRKRTPVPRETSSSLEHSLHEDSSAVMSSQSTASRLKKSKSGSKSIISSKSIVKEQSPSLSVPAFTDHTGRTLLRDQEYFISTNSLPNYDAFVVHHDEDISNRAPRRAPSGTRRRPPGVPRARADLDVPHYKIPGQISSRKKKQPSHALERYSRPDHNIGVIGATGQLPDTQDNAPVASEDAQVGVDDQTEHLVALTPSQPGQLPTELVDVEMGLLDSSVPPAGDFTDRKVPSPPRPDERSMPFAQLRQLERPDQEDELDIAEQPEVDETPTADEPITPPVEHETVRDSIIAEAHDAFLPPTVLGPVNKRRKREITPYVDREPSPSLPPELPESSSLSVISIRSYEIHGAAGKGKRPKPLGFLLATSRYNEELGRKTGRSVKAFGVEVPPFEAEVDFELPKGTIREVARLRADGMSDAGSDGDPPSFAADMEHGEVLHGAVPESISMAR